MELVLLVVGLILAVYQIYATVVLFRAIELSSKQKAVLFIIIWSIPFFGGFTVLGVLRPGSVMPSDRYLGKDIDDCKFLYR